ncbi:MAG TPA: hypothetical protein VMG10_12795 [Gemmataceae bacterium]|nr:hypothetical protein [Gemmataceae bacterium]
MIFAREVTDGLTSLVKKIDEATDKNRSCRMGSFVVFCNDDEGLKKKLEELAEKQKLKRTILSIDNPAGPEGYAIAKDADVTVLLYTKHKVKVNHAYKKGELTEREVKRILSELPTILPEKSN